jgi:hypothetical protein
MQQYLGLVEVEIGIVNTSQNMLDVIPAQILRRANQEDRKKVRHVTELIQLSPEQVSSRGYSRSSPIFPLLPQQQQTSTTGQVVVVGRKGTRYIHIAALRPPLPLQ